MFFELSIKCGGRSGRSGRKSKKNEYIMKDAFGRYILNCPKCETQALYEYEGYYLCGRCGVRFEKTGNKKTNNNKAEGFEK